MDSVTEIKNIAKLSEIASKRIKLTSNGANRFKACCPFHNEKTPSFHIDDTRGIYKCFGCGESGDMFNFIQKTDNLKDFSQSLEVIAQIVGVEIVKVKKDEKSELEKKKTQDINYFASAIFQRDLLSNEVAQKYLVKRGITKTKAEDFCFGFARDSYNFLVSECEKNGFSKNDITNSGFAKKSDNDLLYTIFRNRIMIPIFDISGKCIGFGGRGMTDEITPKYINSFESKVFKKGKTLYNINRAVKKKSDTVIICEGYMDAISLDIAGFSAVAPLGTSITIDQILLAKKYFKKIVFWMDSDKAGVISQKKSANLILEALDNDFEAFFVEQKDGKDPDELIKKFGKSVAQDLVLKAISLHDFLWKNISSEIDFKNPLHLSKLNTEITNLLTQVKNDEIKKEYSFFFKNKIYEQKYNKTKKDHESLKKPTIITENIDKKDKIQIILIKIISIKQDLLDHVEFDFELDEKFSEILSEVISGDLSCFEKYLDIDLSIICQDERLSNQFARFCLEYKAILIEDEIKNAISSGLDQKKFKFLTNEKKKVLEKLKAYNI